MPCHNSADPMDVLTVDGNIKPATGSRRGYYPAIPVMAVTSVGAGLGDDWATSPGLP